MYTVKLKCKRCGEVNVAFKKNANRSLRYYPTCKRCGNRNEYGPNTYTEVTS